MLLTFICLLTPTYCDHIMVCTTVRYNSHIGNQSEFICRCAVCVGPTRLLPVCLKTRIHKIYAIQLPKNRNPKSTAKYRNPRFRKIHKLYKIHIAIHEPAGIGPVVLLLIYCVCLFSVAFNKCISISLSVICLYAC